MTPPSSKRREPTLLHPRHRLNVLQVADCHGRSLGQARRKDSPLIAGHAGSTAENRQSNVSTEEKTPALTADIAALPAWRTPADRRTGDRWCSRCPRGCRGSRRVLLPAAGAGAVRTVRRAFDRANPQLYDPDLETGCPAGRRRRPLMLCPARCRMGGIGQPGMPACASTLRMDSVSLTCGNCSGGGSAPRKAQSGSHPCVTS
jgi:hypothetical protein